MTVSKTPSAITPDPGFIELLPSELTAAAECALECRTWRIMLRPGRN